MIILVHHKERAVRAILNDMELSLISDSIIENLLELAHKYPQELLLWCESSLLPFIDIDAVKLTFHHKRIMTSFSSSGENYISDAIGYIEDKPWINIEQNVTYPTWQMSSDIGGIFGCTLLCFEGSLSRKRNFTHLLNDIAKSGISNGLLCYRAVLLSQDHPVITTAKSSNVELFAFVSSHYKKRWILLLLFTHARYEKDFPIISAIRGALSKSFILPVDLSNIEIKSTIETPKLEYDVIIPTIGREEYLYHVLKGLEKQSTRPNSVIIIEQNENLEENSALHYLKNEVWTFSIQHKYIHRTGACNARNVGLELSQAPWVILFDDDVRIDDSFSEIIAGDLQETGALCLNFSCLKKNETEKQSTYIQWPTFGSGCSIILRKALQELRFDLAFEHGYGEDADFGMDLRKKGIDIIYTPFVRMEHLKAPVGGFRKPFIFPWSQEEISPKPSPTVQLFRKKHQSREQILGYKTVLAIKYYFDQEIKNPIKYFKYFKKAWKRSEYWAHQLKLKSK